MYQVKNSASIFLMSSDINIYICMYMYIYLLKICSSLLYDLISLCFGYLLLIISSRISYIIFKNFMK